MPKILLVDDAEADLILLMRLLEPEGYQILTARDGAEALEAVRKSPPDVILLDLRMPGMDGFEAAKALKGHRDTTHIPIVMVSAMGDAEFRVKALELGVDDFLAKPVDGVELKARVRSSLKIKAYNDQMRQYQKDIETEVERRTQQLRLALERLKETSLDCIFRLSRAGEYKDDDTGGHIQRMSHFAAAAARKLGLDSIMVEGILYAAPMHDIGKIGIPERILLKPGELNPHEWEIMKTHTTIGARILEGGRGGYLKMGEVIAMTHHEKWDGSGYPVGLRGPTIPVAGRVTAIADVFDALTSKRPYREPYSLDTALTIIRNGRGTHFDPDVVDAFLAVQGEILAIREKYRDQGESLLYSATRS